MFNVYLCLMSPEQMNPSLGHEEYEQHQGHQSAPIHHLVSPGLWIVSSSFLPGHSHSLLRKVIVMPSELQLTTGPLRRQHSVSAVASGHTELRAGTAVQHNSLGLTKGCCPEQHNIPEATQHFDYFVTLNSKYKPLCRRIGYMYRV